MKMIERILYTNNIIGHILQGYSSSGGEMQVVLKNQYKIMKEMNCLPRIGDVGFRNFSQFEEDGILLYIFSLIGEGNKRAIEICCGVGYESMTANLIINHGWDAILFDGNPKNVKTCRRFYKTHLSTKCIMQPRVVCEWITKDNVNRILSENRFQPNTINEIEEVDLLSLDIDGNDYYIMSEINTISPRVIICETHSFIPNDLAVTIPYYESFVRKEDYYGASSLAMVQLLKKKGYRFVAAHRYGGNMIFVKNGIGEEYLPEIKIEDIRTHRYFYGEAIERWNKVSNNNWVNVK